MRISFVGGYSYSQIMNKVFSVDSYCNPHSKVSISRIYAKRYCSSSDNEDNALYVVRKGNLVGVYKCLSDCQAQLGSEISDPPIQVLKGLSSFKGFERHLRFYGLKNSMYTIHATDWKDDLFGTIMSCPFSQPEMIETKGASEDIITSDMQTSCILAFDGASKGNPGKAGAGAVLRTVAGNLICKLREGIGVATCNMAEYRAVILGLQYALQKGYTKIIVQGDSRLVLKQIEGSWKVKSPNIIALYEQVAELKNKFTSFQINHVLRDLNSDADAQANLAVELADGQVDEEF